jgi:hypothetical protein
LSRRGIIGGLALAALAGGAPAAGAAPMFTQNACTVANVAAAAPSASCRFVGGNNALGVGGMTDGGWRLTYTAKRAVLGPGGCREANPDGTLKTELVPVTVASGGAGPTGSLMSFVTGRVYTLTVIGTGQFQAGGPGDTPATAEPADAPVDETGGAQPNCPAA